MILEQKFPVSASSTYWGKLYLPDDYNVTTEQHPLFVFCHGKGERGSTQSSLPALDAFGPFQFIKQGHKMEFVSPADSKKYRYIVLALQDPDWSPSAAEVAYCLLNSIFKNYRINRNCIVISGLSAGGDTTLQSITTPGFMELYCAAVPMSPASSGQTNNVAATAAQGIDVWGFVGNADGSFTTNMQAFDAKLNAAAPGTCRTHIYTGGHGGWNEFYDPAYEVTTWGHPMNIYEFGLTMMKGSEYIPSTPPSSSVVAAFNLEDGQLLTENNVTVDGSASQNVRTDWEGYLWGLKPIKGGSWGATPQEGAYGGPIKKMIGLTDGLYELSLTVRDNFGKTNTKTVNFTVDLGNAVPPPVELAPTVADVHTDKGVVRVLKDGDVHFL